MNRFESASSFGSRLALFVILVGSLGLGACSQSPAGGGTGSGGSTPSGTGGGSGGDGQPGDGGQDQAASDGPPGSVVLTPFAGTHVYFAGADNKRIVDVPVTFPPMPTTYERITLDLALRCPPAGGCDFWDRRAFLGIVNNPGPNESVTELARFITPYRIGMRWSLDVTGLRPLLSGPVTLRVFIDTWVGPGHAQGAGWLVDAAFDFRAGVPAKQPLAVIRLWDEVAVGYGDPAKPTSGSAPTKMISVPAGTTSVELRSFITGHGQGNAENCAEFCQKTHGFKVGEKTFERLVWRDDCATTAAPGQAGTFRFPRAGWCPGAGVLPWTQDVTAAVASSGETAVSYTITAYENTCRPDAPMCLGCTLGSGCAYNDGSHTAPFFDLSALLIAYK